MKTKINVLKDVDLEDAIFIEGLPGIGNVGRVSVGYLIDQLDAEKIAEITSPYFLPLVVLDENSEAHMLKNSIYHCERKDGKDLLLLTGDTQSVSGEGHYEICQKVIDFAKENKVSEIITIGGFSTDNEPDKPRVLGAVTDKELIKEYEDYDIEFDEDKPVGTVVGSTGLLLGMAKDNDIKGLTLMGETMGFPLVTDPKAADSVLNNLVDILDLDVDLGKLEDAVEEMEQQIKKTEKIHRKMVQSKKKSDDTVKYIG